MVIYMDMLHTYNVNKKFYFIYVCVCINHLKFVFKTVLFSFSAETSKISGIRFRL